MDFSTNFTVRTDLADESVELLKKKEGKIGDGITFEKKNFGKMTADVVHVEDESGAQRCGKPIGTYITLNVGEVWNGDRELFENTARLIGECIGHLTERGGLSLIVCLGNERIIADAIGPVTARNIIVTRHIKKRDRELFDSLELGEVACVVTGVMGDTGAETVEIVKGIANELCPDNIIVVDALASGSLSRLARTVQITDTGICPGSGVGNNREEISKTTLGVPVVAVGVPTVVETSALCLDLLSGILVDDRKTYEIVESRLKGAIQSSFVCPKETDKIIYTMAKLIGYGINCALHKGMTIDEMEEFLA